MSVKKNERYGKLITKRIVGKSKNRYNIWECVCDCGNIINVTTGKLTSKNTKSCGCMYSESMKNMGKSIRMLNKYVNILKI